MAKYTILHNTLGPIPAWVREHWQGDKPYPKPSLAERNVWLARAADIRRAIRKPNQ